MTPASGATPFLGRGDELAALQRRWAAVRSGQPGLVAVEGEAGIGKTSLLRRFVQVAGPQRLMWASGDEEETGLPWGVLHQLALGPAAAGLRRIADALDPGADPLLVGTGLLSALQPRDGLVVVVDDAHWADRQSLAALRFVVRRLVSEPILLVLSYRPEGFGALGEGWRRLLFGEGTTRLVLRGLGPTDLMRLAARMGKGSLSPAGAARLHEHTGGHPLYARLLLEEISGRVFERAEGPLPAPRDLAMAVAAKVAGCRPEARELLAAAAVLGRSCRLATAEDVAGLQGGDEALQEAVAAGLLAEVPASGGRRVAFPHALLRAAVYDDLGAGRRRELHARAAAAETGTVALVHRLASARAPDEALGNDLEAAAQALQRRGSVTGAATWLVQALHFSPPGPARDRRLRVALELLLVAGDAAGAAQLADMVAQLPPDPWSAYVIGYLALLSGQTQVAVDRFGGAWEALLRGADLPAGAPPDLRARVGSQLAILAVLGFDYDAMADFGDAAVQAGAAEGWVASFAWFARTVGRGLRGDGAEALADLERSGGAAGPGGLDRLVARGMVRLWNDDATGARADLTEAWERACRGEPMRVAQALGYLGEACYRLGYLEEAVLHTELAVANAEESGRLWDLAMLHGLACYPRAARGDWAEAEAHAAAAATWAERVQTGAGRTYAALGRLALADARGEPRAFLQAARDLEATYDSREPGTHLAGPALAEALLRTGDLGGAEAALTAFLARTRAAGRRSSLAIAARVRGELAGANSAWAEASAAFEQAARLVAGLALPIESAKVDAARGRVALARGDRAAAGRSLRAALHGFRGVGAHASAAAVAALLQEAGLETDPGGLGLEVLTPTEAAVARLVAARLSNAEVAARLSMSPKTVEFHLTHVYAKLGVPSRRQLASALGDAIPGDPRL